MKPNGTAIAGFGYKMARSTRMTGTSNVWVIPLCVSNADKNGTFDPNVLVCRSMSGKTDAVITAGIIASGHRVKNLVGNSVGKISANVAAAAVVVMTCVFPVMFIGIREYLSDPLLLPNQNNANILLQSKLVLVVFDAHTSLSKEETGRRLLTSKNHCSK